MCRPRYTAGSDGKCTRLLINELKMILKSIIFEPRLEFALSFCSPAIWLSDCRDFDVPDDGDVNPGAVLV